MCNQKEDITTVLPVKQWRKNNTKLKNNDILLYLTNKAKEEYHAIVSILGSGQKEVAPTIKILEGQSLIEKDLSLIHI